MKMKFVVLCIIVTLFASCGIIPSTKAPIPTPEQQELAKNSINIAKTFLDILDGFYNKLLAQKDVPGNLGSATEGLSMADAAATILRFAKQGGLVTDGQLNTAIGQVNGAKAILENLLKK